MDGVTTSCYYATIDKVNSWLLNFRRRSAPWYMYRDILRPMLHNDPTLRFTAVQVSQGLAFLSELIKRSLQRVVCTVVCTDCRIDMWVDLDDHMIDKSDVKHDSLTRHKTASTEYVGPTLSPKVSSSSALDISKLDPVEKPRETHVHDGRVPSGLESSKTERIKTPAPEPFFKWAIGPNMAKKK